MLGSLVMNNKPHTWERSRRPFSGKGEQTIGAIGWRYVLLAYNSTPDGHWQKQQNARDCRFHVHNQTPVPLCKREETAPPLPRQSACQDYIGAMCSILLLMCGTCYLCQGPCTNICAFNTCCQYNRIHTWLSACLCSNSTFGHYFH
jgi:hypothetical protein